MEDATGESKADTKGKAPAKPDNTTATTRRAQTLNIKFVKMASMAFEIHRMEEGEGAEPKVLAEVKKVQRAFVPFVTQLRTSTTRPGEATTYSGVFFTGDRPNWILGTDKGGIQIFPSGHAVVNAFTPCSIWDERGDFLLYTEEVRVSMFPLLTRTFPHN